MWKINFSLHHQHDIVFLPNWTPSSIPCFQHVPAAAACLLTPHRPCHSISSLTILVPTMFSPLPVISLAMNTSFELHLSLSWTFSPDFSHRTFIVNSYCELLCFTVMYVFSLLHTFQYLHTPRTYIFCIFSLAYLCHIISCTSCIFSLLFRTYIWSCLLKRRPFLQCVGCFLACINNTLHTVHSYLFTGISHMFILTFVHPVFCTFSVTVFCFCFSILLSEVSITSIWVRSSSSISRWPWNSLVTEIVLFSSAAWWRHFRLTCISLFSCCNIHKGRITITISPCHTDHLCICFTPSAWCRPVSPFVSFGTMDKKNSLPQQL